MKILWLSNRVVSGHDYGVTGTWLGALAEALAQSGEVELANICLGSAPEFTHQDYGSIKQWIVPDDSKLNRDGLPNQEIVSAIIKTIDEFNPDIVHVWGTESFWGLLTARKLIKQRALLETQGLKFAIAKSYNGDLTVSEQVSSTGLKEIVGRSTSYHLRKRFARWGRFEREMLSLHRFITVQTDWLEAQVRQYAEDCVIFRNEFMLRAQFYNAGEWRYTGTPTIFCTAAYSAPFKGLHVAVRAMAVLKQRVPIVQLRIAGAHQRKGLRQDAYIAWVNREIRRLKLRANVTWLGPLSSLQIITELLSCSAVIIPSFIEGYCLGLAEAMLIGTPAVASFAGGISCIAKDNETVLFFPPGDVAMCAHQIEKVITNSDIATRLSQESRAIAIIRNNRGAILRTQLEVYKAVFEAPLDNAKLLR
jgi:glycosyltransferase involved in cell wall biosynthesis